MSEAQYQTGTDALADRRDNVLTGTPPTLYPVGTGVLSRLELGPGRVWLMGGAPGAGKTALAMQLLLDALRLTPDLRAIVCNVEMPPAVLLDRQLARLSGADLSTIRHRRLVEAHAERIDQALATLEPLTERLCFVLAPFDLLNVAAMADAFDADLLVLDYIERIPPPGEHGDKRGSVNATMDFLRQFADAGFAVIVLSAIGRTKDRKGRSSYAGDGLSLASFRESSELEYGSDDAFLLTPNDEDGESVTLRHLKSRHGAPEDICLDFCRSLQRFTPHEETASRPDDAGMRADLAALWNRTATEGDTSEAEDE